MAEHEQRLVRYGNELNIEAHQFNGIMQKFPNHFHEYYVIGFVESGKRSLTCKNREDIISAGDLLLFNPSDNHAYQQLDDLSKLSNVSKYTILRNIKKFHQATLHYSLPIPGNNSGRRGKKIIGKRG